MPIPSFTSYVPPGVYTGEGASPTAVVIGSPPSRLAIVGPAVGYRTATQAVTLAAVNPVQLTQLGIIPASVSVSSASGQVYASGADYTLTVGAGADGSIVTTQDNTLTVTRVGTGAITDGEQVFVSFQYRDANYGNPALFSDFNDIVAAYGPPFDPVTGAVISPLSLAAQIATQNGSGPLVLVATADLDGSATTRNNLQTATNLLQTRNDVDLVLVLPVGIIGATGSPGDVFNVGGDLLTFINTMFNQYEQPMIGLIGYDPGVTIAPDVIAGNFASRRMIEAWPNQLQVYNGLLNQSLVVGGQYLAAAYGGFLAGNPQQEPLTKKVMRGFLGMPGSMLAQMTLALRNQYSSAGVAVTEVSRGTSALMVRHGVSTDPSTTENREISITRQMDGMADVIALTLEEAGFIGSYLTQDTGQNLKSLVTSALNQCMSIGMILGFNSLGVRESQVSPTVMEVRFNWLPAWALNYITVIYTIDLSSGLVAAA